MKKETNIIVALLRQPWFLVLLIAMAAIACSDDTRTQERVYLSGTVAPCAKTAEHNVVPCEETITHAAGNAEGGQPSVVVLDIDPLEHPNIFAYDFFEDTPSSRTHIILRGETIPGTLRCRELLGPGQAKFYPTPQPYLFNTSELLCFADLAVHDYIYGEGPSRITVTVVSRHIDPYVVSYEDAEAEAVKRHLDFVGREAIFGLAPEYYIAGHYETWGLTKWIPLMLHEDGTVLVVSSWIDFLERLGRPVPEEHKGKFVWTLEEFEARMEQAALEYTDRSDGRIWEDSLHLPMLLTDVHDLHVHFRDELKAYENVSATPSVPPPAPGEPHSYPEPPGQRPAPTSTPDFATSE